MEAVGRALGVGLSSIVNMLNPEVIVIGGGVIAAGEMLLGPARREMMARALAPARDTVQVRPAAFGDEAGMVGAALLAREEAS
jgi:glucokinase